MPNITYKSCYYLFILTTRKSFVIFTCRNFKLSWNTTARSQSNCRNFSCIGINREINATAAGYKITYFKRFMLRHVTALRLEGYLNFCFILTIAILVTKRSRYVTTYWYFLQTQETHWNKMKTLNIWPVQFYSKLPQNFTLTVTVCLWQGWKRI